MVSESELEELARRPKEPAEALEARLADLRTRGAGLLQCIKYVRQNQGCALSEASNSVINSRAWIDRKDDFLRQQEEAFDAFLSDNDDSIERIQMNIIPEATKMTVHLKPPATDSDKAD